MKQIPFVSIIIYYLIFFTAPGYTLLGQPPGCVLKAPAFYIDFGSANKENETRLPPLRNYEEILHSCPNDGYFSIVSKSFNCYSGNWINLNQDHTPNDIEGKMMVVNASYSPGTFFIAPITGLAGNTTYELGTWMVNVCMACRNETPLPPQFNFIIEDIYGKQLVNFVTGELKPTRTPSWIQFTGQFKTPANVNNLVLRIVNKIRGGCGNDFAMDDITIRECVVTNAIVKMEPKLKPKPAIKQHIPVTKTVVKNTPPVLKPVKKDMPVVTKTPVNGILPISKPMIKQKSEILLPKPILTRTNPIIKQIETVADEIVIDLYDNGEIDGDTVSIYHNNILLVSRAALSAKAVTFRITVDAMHPRHELVMVANNLGSIPPNTSLMIVTARDKRYEVFISSSEQKNAKIVIGLKE